MPPKLPNGGKPLDHDGPIQVGPVKPNPWPGENPFEMVKKCLKGGTVPCVKINEIHYSHNYNKSKKKFTDCVEAHPKNKTCHIKAITGEL